MTVTDQTSIVLSPATLKIRPLNGTSMFAMVEAGSYAALHIYLKLVASQEIPPGSVVNSTSNKLGLAPPPTSADLN